MKARQSATIATLQRRVRMPSTLHIVLQAAIPIVAAYVLNIVLNRFLDNDRLHGKLHLILIKSLFSAAIWVAAIVVSLSSFSSFSRGWETVIAGSGIVAVVLGLAAQETLGNVFAGISMSTAHSRPFDIGDRVKIGDAEPGYVQDITLRHVVLLTYLNSAIIIPNSVVGKSMITNYTAQDACGYPIEIQVAYSSDINRAMEIMADVIETHPKHYGEGPVRVLCKECGDSGVLLKGVVTTKDFADNAAACSDCLMEIMRRFLEEDISIPYRKIEVIHKEGKDVSLSV